MGKYKAAAIYVTLVESPQAVEFLECQIPEVSSFKREDLPKLRRGFADIDHKMLMDEASTIREIAGARVW